jgi:hypothetical protein
MKTVYALRRIMKNRKKISQKGNSEARGRLASTSTVHRSATLASLRVLLIVGGLCCCAPSLVAQSADSTINDQGNDSWKAATDLKSDDLLPTRIPVRITESHRKNGNRTFEERSVQVQGLDGHLVPYQEIETETVQVDAATIRTTTRTFGRDVNGARSLIQVTEEEKHTLPGGDSNVQRTIFNPDVNGKLQPVQQETAETKTISQDVQETNTTVMLPNINNGLAPALKSHELRKRRADGTTESQQTTLLADGAEKWELSETRQVTTRQDGANRAAEERVSRRDAEGKLIEVSRVVSEETNTDPGAKRAVVETYSVDMPGTTRDGSLHLVERATTSSQTDSTGRQTTQQTVEQPNPGDPGAGLRVSVLIDDKMMPSSSGEQSTVTIQTRDTNNRFEIVSVDTRNSDRVPTIQIQQTPSTQGQ